MKKGIAILLAVMMLTGTLGSALAESFVLEGSVVSTITRTVTSPVGGRVASVLAGAGQSVKAGETIALLETEKVHAQRSGIVRLFGEVGDSTEMVSNRFGAVAYIEPDDLYIIESASTKYAADEEENKTIHPGEAVVLKCYSDGQHTGTGIVTSVSGTTYTVEATSGIFKNGETVLVYRNSAISINRIGRGSIARHDPEAYTGEGLIAVYNVTEGQHVNKGDVLFETVSGTFGSKAENLTEVTVPVDGVITSVGITPGTTLDADGAVAEVYPAVDLRVKASVTESDLDEVQPGDRVKLELTYFGKGDQWIMGTVERVALTADEDTTEEADQAGYTLYIIPDSIEMLRYGMNVLVNVNFEDGEKAAS